LLPEAYRSSGFGTVFQGFWNGVLMVSDYMNQRKTNEKPTKNQRKTNEKPTKNQRKTNEKPTKNQRK